MSGGFVPYNLRQNKAVERAVFIDLLQRISRSTELHLHDYTYIGFAGAFSEDFKLVHSALGISKLISIEEDSQVYKRQQWNSPIDCIKYNLISSRDFIDQFQPSSSVIAWLDFTRAADVGLQLGQAEMLLSKLGAYDVFKITVNANEKTLNAAAAPPADGDEDRDEILALEVEARRRLGNYLPAGIALDDEDFDRSGYPKLLLLAIESAVKRGVQGKPDCYFQPLASFVYADSEQQMLTHTGIILPDALNKNHFLNETRIRKWKLATTDWGNPRTDPIRISIPEMSLRERLYVDQRLPSTSPSRIARAMGLRLTSGSPEKTRAALASYKLFYRHYPFFSRVVV